MHFTLCSTGSQVRAYASCIVAGMAPEMHEGVPRTTRAVISGRKLPEEGTVAHVAAARPFEASTASTATVHVPDLSSRRGSESNRVEPHTLPKPTQRGGDPGVPTQFL